jgi:hypothetical protein
MAPKPSLRTVCGRGLVGETDDDSIPLGLHDNISFVSCERYGKVFEVFSQVLTHLFAYSSPFTLQFVVFLLI